MKVSDVLAVLRDMNPEAEVWIGGTMQDGGGSPYTISISVDLEDCEWQETEDGVMIDITPAEIIAEQDSS